MMYTILAYTFQLGIITYTLFIIYFIYIYNYWKRLDVPFRPTIVPYGNTVDVVKKKKTHSQAIGEVYREFKDKGFRHAGFYFFHKPVYVPIDLDLIKYIVQVDFQHFVDRGVYYNEKDDPLSAHLFSIEGQKWKNLRAKLTPTFTSGKMKMMFPMMVDISKKLLKAVEKFDVSERIEVKKLSTRFTTDVIGCCAFGIDCNSLSDPNTEFCVYGKRLFTLTNYELARTFLTFILPDVGRTLGIRLLPNAVADFFWKIIKDNANHRESNDVRKDDFFQLLLDMKNGTRDEEKLTYQEFAAQAFLFFVGGYETSSLTISLALYELARNEVVQNKLRDEIKTIIEKHGGKFTYDGLSEMHYMDMVIKETLRKYPPVSIINRVCTQEYKVPDSELTLKKGVKIFVPIEAIHYDPEFYPNPHQFDPERFTSENINRRHHFAYLPFGEGPRNCIGTRFGMMQTKVGLTTLLRNYRLKLNPNTEPVKMSLKHFINIPANPIWIDFEKI